LPAFPKSENPKEYSHDLPQGISYTGGRGRVTMHARHLLSDIYLAKADGLKFKILAHFPAP